MSHQTDHIRPGQVWRCADPREDIRPIRVRVTAVTDGRVHVVDADTGTRPRTIAAAAFHATPTTRTGQPRRSGYVLTEERPR